MDSFNYPKFSIITPQYNSFDLMNNYFDSLLNQTVKNFEVIIVDDCSNDGSWEKLIEYKKNTPLNITLLQSKKNSGPGNARNIGISVARGEWITFVDNDDWVDTYFLETIQEVINKEKTHCVIYDYYTWFDGKINTARSMYKCTPGRKTISECISYVRNHTIGKVYNRQLCAGIKYPNLKRCEDVAYVCQAIAACGDAYYINKPMYYYRQRSSSLSNNKQLDHQDMVKAFSILEDVFKKEYPLQIKNKSVTDILYGALLMMCKSGKSNKEILFYIKEYENKYPSWWECEIINYLGMSKRVFLKCVKMHFVLGLKAISYAHSFIIKQG